ncbi:Endo-1,4-beta-xylanase [Mycena indigotica]|uniref:Endo-1,4-beta-xylanase n=1 Tax=Mycena indigotica TaxID=2126181 RepID=A0A8H6VRY1_9AGAR|nr:Endo-1,4-beta-xylanase [Mycena indigotica]KAF7289801.1 Endo-1,4-beta-xylanase [Mycena indigotica]
MGFFTSSFALLAVAVASASALLIPTNATFSSTDLSARGVQGTGQGTFNGFFWTNFATSGFSSNIFTNIAGGQYKIQWSGSGDFVVGQGFNPGSKSKVVNFNAQWGPNPASASLLSVYGWSTSPLVEYYINEQSNNFNLATANPGTTHKGTVTSDGSVYDIYEHQQVNQPSIQGTATFQQYISVRQNKRTSGSVTVQNHVNAWASLGMPLGTMNYQVVAVEGLGSSGQATVTVS